MRNNTAQLDAVGWMGTMGGVESETIGRVLMRILATLVISCLALSAGCAESPYDAAQRRQRELAANARREQQEQQREQEKMERWEAILVADAMATFMPLLDEANENLRELDGVVYVDVQEYDRVVFFEKILDEQEVAPYLAVSPAVSYEGDHAVITGEPEDTIPSEWTDRFALAQEFSCRYEIGAADLIVDLDSPTPFIVRISMKLVGTQRHAVAGQAAIPEPPEGYTYWADPESSGHGWFGSSGGPPRFSVSPGVPPGQPHQPGRTPLADQAAEMLSAREPSPVDFNCLAVVFYDSQEAEWRVDEPESGLITLGARELSWSHGISDEHRHHVFAPR